MAKRSCVQRVSAGNQGIQYVKQRVKEKEVAAKYKQNLVSRSCWPWQGLDKNEKMPASRSAVSLLPLVVSLIVASLLFWYQHSVMAVIVLLVAGCIFIADRFFSKIYVRIESFFRLLAHYVGLVLSWLLFVPFYLIFISLGRILFKLSGKDPMTRTLDPQIESYWLEHQSEETVDQYRRQF